MVDFFSLTDVQGEDGVKGRAGGPGSKGIRGRGVSDVVDLFKHNLVKYIGVGTVVELMRILHTSNSHERKCVVMNNIMCVIYCVIEHIISK